MALAPRAVVVHRRSELETLLDRHGTRGQAEFFLRSRGRDLGPVQVRHDALHGALAEVEAAIPAGWRRSRVEREDLARLRFDPEDVVVAVGQDGLVANVAKYLAGQPVIGVDPEPGRNPGVLVRHRSGGIGPVLAAVAGGGAIGGSDGGARFEQRCMVAAELDDGQRLTALNEIYVGDDGHQSARYGLKLTRVAGGGAAGGWESQSSSGVLVGTGTGASGWCASLAADRGVTRLPGPADRSLAWFVREAWPSPATGRGLTAGLLEPGRTLQLRLESDLVVFGDGLESDRLLAGWGQQLTLGLAETVLRLVVP